MSQNETDSKIKIDIKNIILGALSLIRDNFYLYVKRLSIPFGFYLFVSGLGFYSSNNWDIYFFYIALLIAHTLIAVNCHRLILLGTDSTPHYGAYFWSMRETRFFLHAFILVMLAYGSSMLFFGMINMLLIEIPDVGLVSVILVSWIPLLFFILMFYFLGRLLLVFPSIAIDKPISFLGSWYLSINNGWRLAIAVLLVPFIIDFIFRIILSVFGNDSFWLYMASELLYFPLLVFGVLVLSLSYKALVLDLK